MPNPQTPKSVTFYYYPKFIFAWPLIVAGVLFWLLYFAIGSKADTTLGWIYQSILIIVVATLGIDLRFRHMLVCLVLVLLLVVSLVALNLAGVDIYTGPFVILKLCNPYFDAGGALFVSIVLAILYILMYWWVHLFQKVHIDEGGEVIVSIYGESDITFLADNRVVNVDFPDVLERIMVPGTGALIITDRMSGKTLRLENIPRLASLQKQMEHLFSTETMSTRTP